MLFPWLLIFAACFAPSATTKIEAINLCESSMELYIGSHGPPTTIEQGVGHNLELTDGNNAAYRYGASYQATQAEFANVDSSTWFDISIIPAGGTGPGSCSSLEDCKRVTGGTGFNVAMQIIPSIGGGLSSSETCRVLSCLEDGCNDAYQFPDQDARTHSCSAEVEFQVIFCASNRTQLTSDSATDFWVNTDTFAASGSSSTSSANSSKASRSADNSHVQSQSEVTSAPPYSEEKKTTNTDFTETSNSTSWTIYLAAAIVAVLVATVFVIKRRHAIAFWWETRRYKEGNLRNSDELGFVRISDEIVI